MNKNDLRFIKTERLIKDSFIHLINEKEYNKITITEICQRSMISRNAFYIHYQTIDDLLTGIYKDIENFFYNSFPNTNNTEKLTKWYIDIIDDNKFIISSLLKCPSLHFNKILFNCVIKQPMSSMIDDFDIITNDIRVKMNIEYMLNAMISFTKCWLDNYDQISKKCVYEDLFMLCKEPTKLFYEKINILQSNKL